LTRQYRRIKVSRGQRQIVELKAFAVLAFCAEITRLPGHCDPRSTPEKATAHHSIAVDERGPI
jgi:hypothetical protein